MPPKSAFPRYERPPVIERVASVFAPMDPEFFEGRFESWREIVERDFPIYEPVKEWLIDVKSKDGIPIYDTMVPELRITPRFSKKLSQDGFDRSIRCPCGQFTMNMHSKPGDRRGYTNLAALFSDWLSRWAQHFEVKKAERVILHYVNKLDEETIPKFVSGDGSLSLDKIINVFAQIPGAQKYVIPPYDCKATVLLLGRENATLLLQVQGGGGSRPEVRVDFVVNAETLTTEKEPREWANLADWCHERIIERFEVVFTEEAKSSFVPLRV